MWPLPGLRLTDVEQTGKISFQVRTLEDRACVGTCVFWRFPGVTPPPPPYDSFYGPVGTPTPLCPPLDATTQRLLRVQSTFSKCCGKWCLWILHSVPNCRFSKSIYWLPFYLLRVSKWLWIVILCCGAPLCCWGINGKGFNSMIGFNSSVWIADIYIRTLFYNLKIYCFFFAFICKHLWTFMSVTNKSDKF